MNSLICKERLFCNIFIKLNEWKKQISLKIFFAKLNIQI